MKIQTKLLAAALLLGGAHSAFAVELGTNANTPIENHAYVDFKVGGVDQTQTAGDATFVVDRKVDVLVESVSGDSVAPLATGKILTFDVTNKTNDTLDFLLTTEQLTGDDFDASNLEVWVDTNGNGTLDLTDPDGVGGLDADTQQAYIDQLGEDVTIKVWVLGDIPDSGTDPGEVEDGDTSDIVLIAQAADGDGIGTAGTALTETAGADDPANVDNVFADAAGTAVADQDEAQDGRHSDTATYTVGAASVTVAKTMKVVWEHYDQVTPANSENFSGNGAPAYDANLKPIPGALIEYCILVTNTGGQAATDVTITDLLDVVPVTGHLDWVADSIRTNTTCDYATGIAEDDDKDVDDPDAGGPLTTDEGGAGPTGDLVGADYNVTTANKVTATATNVAPTNGAFAVMFQLIVR